MKRRLTYINPLKLGITIGIIYGVISLIFAVPVFLIFSLIGAAGARTGAHAMPIGLIIFMPIIYAVVGFLSGVIAAFIYNLVAKWTGGVEFTTEEVS